MLCWAAINNFIQSRIVEIWFLLLSARGPLMGDNRGQLDASASSYKRRFQHLFLSAGRADGACVLGALD